MNTTLFSTSYEKNLFLRLGFRNRSRECRGQFKASVSIFLFLMITMITIKPENIKIKDIIMNAEITNIESTINLSTIANKEFVLWLKQEIKDLVADQKIAKRDRKDERHPCPDERKYKPYEAWERANSNGVKLRIYYAVYHVLRHHREFKWEEITMKKGSWWNFETYNWMKEFADAAEEIDMNFSKGWDWSWWLRRELGNLVEKFCVKKVNEWNAEKALCHS